MAIKLLFEDGDNTPSSILLRKSFCGSNIFFSNGCSRLLDTAMKIKGDDDKIYVFYDVSPNYPKTTKGYKALVDIIKSDKIKYKDIYVVPIICIEYYICKMFHTYGYMYSKNSNTKELITNLVETFDWNNMSTKLKSDKYISTSLEHAYKNIISGQSILCLNNHFKYNRDGTRNINTHIGKFYTEDCNCERKYCPNNIKDELRLKAERFYTSLPIFAVASEEHKKLLNDFNIKIYERTNKDLKMELQQFFNDICNNMKIAGFKVSI